MLRTCFMIVRPVIRPGPQARQVAIVSDITRPEVGLVVVAMEHFGGRPGDRRGGAGPVARGGPPGAVLLSEVGPESAGAGEGVGGVVARRVRDNQDAHL